MYFRFLYLAHGQVPRPSADFRMGPDIRPCHCSLCCFPSVMIAQWDSSLFVLLVARVQFPATAEYFKGFFFGWSHSANPSWASVAENGSISPHPILSLNQVDTDPLMVFHAKLQQEKKDKLIYSIRGTHWCQWCQREACDTWLKWIDLGGWGTVNWRVPFVDTPLTENSTTLSCGERDGSLTTVEWSWPYNLLVGTWHYLYPRRVMNVFQLSWHI